MCRKEKAESGCYVVVYTQTYYIHKRVAWIWFLGTKKYVYSGREYDIANIDMTWWYDHIVSFPSRLYIHFLWSWTKEIKQRLLITLDYYLVFCYLGQQLDSIKIIRNSNFN